MLNARFVILKAHGLFVRSLARGPFKPGFGLSGAVLELDKVVRRSSSFSCRRGKTLASMCEM